MKLLLVSCELQANSNCLLVVTPKGGHLGWVAGSGAPFGGPWTEPVVMDFLEHLEEKGSRWRGSSGDVEGGDRKGRITEGVEYAEV